MINAISDIIPVLRKKYKLKDLLNYCNLLKSTLSIYKNA